MRILARLWDPAVYWPAWAAAAVTALLLREVWALASVRPQDTLSDWVWRVLRISRDTQVTDWTAAQYLTFGTWVVFMSWLTFHLFFHRFTGHTGA